jgi:hypothetical protein
MGRSSPIPYPDNIFVDPLKRRRRAETEGFFEVSRSPVGQMVIHEAMRIVTKIQEADAVYNVLVVMAHDESLIGIVDFYP